MSNFFKRGQSKIKQIPEKYKKALRIFGKSLGTVFLVFTITGIICLVAFIYYVMNYLNPSMDIDLANFNANQTSYMYYLDEEGNMVEQATLTAEGIREWMSITDMPQHLINATIAIEDERFWQHNGVDWKRTSAAILNLFTGGDSSFGASTITQQLVKNLTGEDEISMTRKIEEILRALNLQKNNTKQEILEYYLNTIFLSENCYGVGAASEIYFGKPASELTIAESAALVGITKYPSLYNPYLHPDKNKKRQETILWKMKQLGMISGEQYEEAKNETLEFMPRQSTEQASKVQSYFVDQVYYDVLNDLVNKKGYTKEFARSYILGGGLKIITSMDKKIQDEVDNAFCNEDNWAKVKTKELPQGSIVILDNSTGAVVALYGGRGEKTGSLTLNRATGTLRQPGSTIKPLSVYGPALEYGVITEGDVYLDTPYKDNWPKNQTGGYTGPMTIKTAVELSKNTVAVKVLADLGADRSFDFMVEKLGFTSLVRSKKINNKVYSDVDLSPLALGGLTDGVSVLEMAAGYETYANNGVYTKPYTYTQVLDADGNVILENEPEQSIAVSEQTAFIVNDLLKNVVKYGTGTPAKISNMTVAGKTGTTSDDNDRWFAGYTPYYTAVVWFGYDIPQEIRVSGTNPALRLWKAAMTPIHKGLSFKDFERPSGITTASYCVITGDSPNGTCKVDSAYYMVGTTPHTKCSENHNQQVEDVIPPDTGDPNTDSNEGNEPGNNPDTGTPSTNPGDIPPPAVVVPPDNGSDDEDDDEGTIPVDSNANNQ